MKLAVDHCKWDLRGNHSKFLLKQTFSSSALVSFRAVSRLTCRALWRSCRSLPFAPQCSDHIDQSTQYHSRHPACPYHKHSRTGMSPRRESRGPMHRAVHSSRAHDTYNLGREHDGQRTGPDLQLGKRSLEKGGVRIEQSLPSCGSPANEARTTTHQRSQSSWNGRSYLSPAHHRKSASTLNSRVMRKKMGISLQRYWIA